MDSVLYNQLDLLSIFVVKIYWRLQDGRTTAEAFPDPLALSEHQHVGTSKPGRMWLSTPAYLEYVTEIEALEIIEQFESIAHTGRQLVFWTGMARNDAQEWADSRGRSTLTTMMGPLMDISDQRCPYHHKTSPAWSKYVKGASMIFSLYACTASSVTVLTLPPPLQADYLRPKRTFVTLEEPILKGCQGSNTVMIKHIHPMVTGAEDFEYEVWPSNRTALWTERYGDTEFTIKCRQGGTGRDVIVHYSARQLRCDKPGLTKKEARKKTKISKKSKKSKKREKQRKPKEALRNEVAVKKNKEEGNRTNSKEKKPRKEKATKKKKKKTRVVGVSQVPKH